MHPGGRGRRRRWLRRALATVAACAGLLTAFAAGVWYSPRVMGPYPSWTASETFITCCPPPEGELFTVRDFIRANEAVEAYMNEMEDTPEHEGLRLLYTGTPSDSGYYVYRSSGDPSRRFPEKLGD